jgi:predicted metal-dependent hydrolase
MDSITVRQMDFHFDKDMELVFIDQDPAMSYMFLGSWMLLPYLEPYLIRSVRMAMKQVNDQELKEEMQRFCAQEGNHYKEHAKANEVVRLRSGAADKLQALEDTIDAEYKRLSKEKSLRFNLAYAEGFEAMTSATSRAQFEVGFFDAMHSPIRELIEWHVLEELEHRNVAFEAYEAVSGGYFYRLFVGLWAQWHFISLSMKLAKILRDADPDTFQKYNSRSQRWLRIKRTSKYLLKALPKVLNIYMPWYSPRKFELPAVLAQVQKRYNELATTTR